MKNTTAGTLAALLMISATAAFGGVKEKTVTVSPVIGGYVFDNNQHLDASTLIGIRGGYNFTKNLGAEALYDYVTSTDGTITPVKDITTHRYGAQALYHFFPDNKLVPYVDAGASWVNFNSGSTYRTLNYGLGAKYFITDNLALRGDAQHIFSKSLKNNIELTLGAYLQFGAPSPAMKPVAAPVPEPAKAAPVPEPVKAAPVPEPVKAAPAPVAAVPVVAAPIVAAVVAPLDSDKDGVIDAIDKCPGTPDGVKVDANGCPVDSDKDGVADYLDKCPDTPAGAPVDGSGCPLDSDKDGVADYLDKCPNTPAGVSVDAKGCPVEVAKKFCDKPATINVVFDTNKSEVKAMYHQELDKIVAFLKEFPNSKGSIEGHTDADGNKDANLKLSQARAESVRDYIVKKAGINAARVTAKGYGMTKPVASNKTAAGKTKNRRIEAIFSCE